MTRAAVEAPHEKLPPTGLKSLKRLLLARPEFRNRRFWSIQGLILIVAVIHDVIEVWGLLTYLGLLYFLPITLFLLPVVYAGLTFGLAGAVATTTWVAMLTVPNWVLWHDGVERLGVILQFVVITSIASLVGWRVDVERRARHMAEVAVADQIASDLRYRHLFEASPVCIFFVSADGRVLEANAEACRLCGRDGRSLKGDRLADLIGASNAAEVLSNADGATGNKDLIAIEKQDGITLYMKPTVRNIRESSGQAMVQLVLRDVTEERNQRAGLKAYAAFVIRAQEEERLRMARELHDEVVQAVILLRLQLDEVEVRYAEVSPDELRVAKKMGEKVVNDLRGFAKRLRPPLLDDLGLVATLKKTLHEFEVRCDVLVHLKVVGHPRRLSPDMEIGLFRIAQEAISNVERHARAKNVTAVLTFDDRHVTLDVIDDGIGFDQPTDRALLATSGHLGLIGMQERAELLGGSLRVETDIGSGTRVRVSMTCP